MKIDTVSQFRTAMRLPQFTHGYEHYFITEDGYALCMECAKEARSLIVQSLRSYTNDCWRVTALASSADTDDYIACDNCSRVIYEGSEDEESSLQQPARCPICYRPNYRIGAFGILNYRCRDCGTYYNV